MQKRRDHPDRADVIASALPIRPTAFAVLAALAEGPQPGFAILEAVNASVPDRPILGGGTLYRLLRELRQSGWIVRTAAPHDESQPDDRRQYHALTPLGRDLLRAEADRLRSTLHAAGLLPPLPDRS